MKNNDFTSITYRRFLHILERNTILNKDVLSVHLYLLPSKTLEQLATTYKNTYLSSKDNTFFVDCITRFWNYIRLKYRAWKFLNYQITEYGLGYELNFYFNEHSTFFLNISKIFNRYGLLFTSNVINSYFYRILSEFELLNKTNMIYDDYIPKNYLYVYITTLDLFKNLFNNIYEFGNYNFDTRNYYYHGNIVIFKLNHLNDPSIYYDYYRKKECIPYSINDLIPKNIIKTNLPVKIACSFNNKLLSFENLEPKDQIKQLLLSSAEDILYTEFLTEELLDDPRLLSPQISYIFKNKNNLIRSFKNIDFEEIYEIYTILYTIANNDLNNLDILVKFINRFFLYSPMSVDILIEFLKSYKTIPNQILECSIHYSYNQKYYYTHNIEPILDKYIYNIKSLMFSYIEDKLRKEFMCKYNRIPEIFDTICQMIDLNYKYERDMKLKNNYTTKYISDCLVEKYVQSFNIKSTKSIKNFNSIQLLDLSRKYDLQHLDFRVLLYLHYFNIHSIKYPGILDSNILKYIIKYGNKLSDNNLKEICLNIDVLLCKECKNIKQIIFHILESKAIKEKEKYENSYSEFDFSNNTCILTDNAIKLKKYKMYMLKPNDLRLFTIGISTDCCYHFDGAAENSLLYSVCMPNSTALVIEDNNKHIKAQAWVWCSKDKNTLVLDNIEFVNDGDIMDYIEIIKEYIKNSPYQNIHLGTNYMNIDEDLLIPYSYDIKKEYIEIPLEFDDVSFEKIDTTNSELYSDYNIDDYVILKHNGKCLIK